MSLHPGPDTRIVLCFLEYVRLQLFPCNWKTCPCTSSIQYLRGRSMSSGSRLSFRAFLKPILHALGEFLRANSKKVGTDPIFSRRIFSLINRIAKICFSLRTNKFARCSLRSPLYHEVTWLMFHCSFNSLKLSLITVAKMPCLAIHDLSIG
jgi:hypothetical protein